MIEGIKNVKFDFKVNKELGEIYIENSMEDHVSRLIKTRDDGVKKALKILGWLSPEEHEALKKSHAELVEACQDILDRNEIQHWFNTDKQREALTNAESISPTGEKPKNVVRIELHEEIEILKKTIQRHERGELTLVKVSFHQTDNNILGNPFPHNNLVTEYYIQFVETRF